MARAGNSGLSQVSLKKIALTNPDKPLHLPMCSNENVRVEPFGKHSKQPRTLALPLRYPDKFRVKTLFSGEM